MTQDRTYTIIERDGHGTVLNTITGLDGAQAVITEAALRRGTAYTGERPRTCEMVAERPREAQVEQAAQRWLTCTPLDLVTLSSPVEMAEALYLLGQGLSSLGDQEICKTWMSVDFQVTSPGGDEAARRRTVDLLAAVIGVTPTDRPHGSYKAECRQMSVYTVVSTPEPVDATGQADSSPRPITAERVEQILRELNRRTNTPAEAEVDWWDWLNDQPELHREATAAASTTEVHLTDGTVLPTREQMFTNAIDALGRAYAALGDAADWLRSDWTPPGCPLTVEQSDRRMRMFAQIDQARQAVNRARNGSMLDGAG